MNLIHLNLVRFQGNLLLLMNRPEAAVAAFRGAQELRPDLRSYQGVFSKGKPQAQFVIISILYFGTKL